jgi:hypothetical protein
MHFLDASGKPMFQLSPPRSSRHEINAKTYFAQDDRVDDDLAFVGAKPFDHPRQRLRLGRFAQDIGMDKDLIPLKKRAKSGTMTTE